MRIEPLGDRAVRIVYGAEISLEAHRRVRRATEQLRAARLAGVTDVVPAFASVTVHYEPAAVTLTGAESPNDSLVGAIGKVLSGHGDDASAPATLVEIPVCYGAEYGPDLDDLARAHGILPDEVIRLHAEPEYLVYMLGFLPGFPYLGGLDPRLTTPRRAEPRTRVPAGSVGIGGAQTGVYPLESPGGWHLIGRTPLRLFTPRADRPTLLLMGDHVRFRAVSVAEFRDMELADT